MRLRTGPPLRAVPATVQAAPPARRGLSVGRVVANSASQLATYGLAWGVRAVAAILVARSLGTAGLGLFTVAWTAASMLAVFAPLGLPALLVREANKEESDCRPTEALSLCVLLSVSFGAALGMGPRIAGASPGVADAMTAAGVFVAVSGPTRLLRAHLHARERMELETGSVAAESLVGLAGVIAGLSAGLGVAGAMAGLAAGQAAGLLVTGVLVARATPRVLRPSARVRSWGALLAASLPMAIAYACTTLTLRIDVLLLGLWRPAGEVGAYAAASVLLLAAPVVAAALGGALFPAMSRTADGSPADFVRMVRWAWGLLGMTGVAASVTLLMGAGQLIEAVYGAGFGDAPLLLGVLGLVLPFRFWNTFCGTGLVAAGLQGPRMRATAAAAAVNVGLNLVLISAIGSWGAVAATLAAEIVLTASLVRHLPGSGTPIRRPLTAGVLVGLPGVLIALTPARATGGLLAAAVLVGAVWILAFRGLPTPRREEIADSAGALSRRSDADGTNGPPTGPIGSPRFVRQADGAERASA